MVIYNRLPDDFRNYAQPPELIVELPDAKTGATD